MTGLLLSDGGILAAIRDGRLIVSGLDLNDIDLSKADCPIQPSSLDLHVGRILIPPKEPVDLSEQPKEYPEGETGYKIPPGHSVIVETREDIRFAGDIAGFGFPPATLARSGLLMTNPGHVDPGYSGRLTFTMINMGREECSLKRDAGIVTLLIFRLQSDVHFDYSKRNPKPAGSSSVLGRVLNQLAPDFANFSARAKETAEREVERQRLALEVRKIYVPIVMTLATGLLALLVGNNLLSIATESFVKTQISEKNAPIDKRLSELANQIDGRLNALNNNVSRLNAAGYALSLDERLEGIERKLNALEEKKL